MERQLFSIGRSRSGWGKQISIIPKHIFSNRFNFRRLKLKMNENYNTIYYYFSPKTNF